MSSVPCRVTADLRRYEAEQDKAERFAPTDEDRAEAWEQITDDLITGKVVSGWTITDVIDCEMDGGKMAALELSQVLNVYADEACASSLWLRVLEWQKKLVKKWVPEEIIEERAEQLAREDML